MTDDIKLRAAIHNNSVVVCVQNEKTGEKIEAYKMIKHYFDIETLSNLGSEWIEQPRYISTKALMMYICAAGIALSVAVSCLWK